jgi:hypothetical protein
MRAAEVLHGAPISATDLARARLESGAEAVPPTDHHDVECVPSISTFCAA